MRRARARRWQRFCRERWTGWERQRTAWRSCGRKLSSDTKERLTQRLLAATGPEFNGKGCLRKWRCWWNERYCRGTDADDDAHWSLPGAIGGRRRGGQEAHFLLQEMNASQYAAVKDSGVGGKGTRVTELGLAMKAEIEKAREQIQNVE